MTSMTRRELARSAIAISLSAAGGYSPSSFSAEERTMAASAFEYQHSTRPLPFKAGSLNGLSEKLIQSHWENNYGGAVKALNTLRGRLVQALNDENTPPYVYTGLKREQSIRTGSVVLHELYFANLGGDGKAGAGARKTIADSFGTFDAWEAEFRKIGQGLSGGSGWVILGYNESLGLLENYWMTDHATHPASTRPVLAMDMYEHAFQMDYGAAAARYIDAFMANVNWDDVQRRLESDARR